MADRRLRVLAIGARPTQYQAPLFRRIAARGDVDLQVAYCTMGGAAAARDPEFGTTVQWDVPLLDGYAWKEVPNRGSGQENFWGLRNPRLWRLIRDGNFDAVLCFVSYRRATFWIARAAAKFSRTAFLFGTDAMTLLARDGRSWKAAVKRLFWPILFRLADQVIVPSTGSKRLMHDLRIPDDRVTLTPYTVDNDWWIENSDRVDGASTRATWNVQGNAKVVLFCAKLQPLKRPLDALCGFARANVPDAVLIFAGEGPLRAEIERQAAALGIAPRVRVLGFVNQSGLPAVYASADVMVLPSEYEPFAVVVNEAMCCGCPVIASDRVGAAEDLIAHGRTGFVYTVADIDKLARTLSQALASRDALHEMGRAARERMRSWSPQQNIEATLEAVSRGVARVRREPRPTLPATPAKPAHVASQKSPE